MAVGPLTSVVAYIDPSGKGVDETAYSIVGHLNGNLYVLEVGSFCEGYTEPVLTGIAEAQKKQGKSNIIGRSVWSRHDGKPIKAIFTENLPLYHRRN